MGEVFAAFRDTARCGSPCCAPRASGSSAPGWDLKAAAAGDAVDGDYGVGGFGGIQELPGLTSR